MTKRRTEEEGARQMKWLVDDVFSEAEVIRVALENLNIHMPAVLYQTFPPEEARRLTRKLAFHSTPKHGGWLNMTAIENAADHSQKVLERSAILNLVRARSVHLVCLDILPICVDNPTLQVAQLLSFRQARSSFFLDPFAI